MEAFVEIIDHVLDVAKEPVLVMVIVGLFWLVYHKDKCLAKMSAEHNAELELLSKQIVGEIGCVNKSLAKQVTLLELIIYQGNPNRR